VGPAGLVLLPGAGARPLDQVVDRALAVGLRRVAVLAWRDLDDPEAGGSERHAHHVAALWAAAGLDVTVRTSSVVGHRPLVERDGYRVLRRGGRYSVFPRSALRGLTGGVARGPVLDRPPPGAAPRRRGRPDGLVEIWNGMPFFSPLWWRGPRVVFLHHVHAEMWRMVLRPGRARLGELVERRLAPPLYRRSRVVTLSDSSKAEIVSMLGLRPSRVDVVPPGIDPSFSSGDARCQDPLVVAVGRLVPVKRFDLLIDALVQVRRDVPRLRAVIVGEGYERARLEVHRRAVGAEDWIELPGHMDVGGLRDLYRRAWVVASTSQREGWGMTISEAGACGTPAVASRIAGHADAVGDGVSGLLVDLVSPPPGRATDDATAGFADALRAVLCDPALRAELGRGARRRARGLTWEATAAGTLEALVDDAVRRLPAGGDGCSPSG